MSTTTDPSTPRRRAPMTYRLETWAVYGWAMAAVAELQRLGRPTSSTDVARFLADRRTPFGNNDGTNVPGKLGVGWYPMSTARLLVQVEAHGYPMKRDPDTGQWRMGTGGTREVRDAIAECYRKAAVDPRPPMDSQSF